MTSSPQIHVDSVRKVFDDGNHNAMTDLCRFGARMYLTFRSCADGHLGFPTSRIVILSSSDGLEWEQVHEFSIPERDVRDPHFLCFKDQLFVYTGTWYCGDPAPAGERRRLEMNQQLGYGVVSADGCAWSEPIVLEGTYGHFIWRAAAHEGTAYLCGRRKRDFAVLKEDDRSYHESAMLESDDGLIWRKRALFQTTHGNETAFLFEPDGSVLAVARSRMEKSQLCRSKPPYTEWVRTDLNCFIGGPLLAKWGERYLVGGRKMFGRAHKYSLDFYTEKGAVPPDDPRTVLYWLEGESLVDAAELPSGGDNSYPGFIELSPTRGLLSYYSSHEGSGSGAAPCSIYLAELGVGA